MTKETFDSCGRKSRRRGHRGHGERKERVLHTRVSEQLSDDIRKFADDLRVPASNLVRNVLEEVFTMVDGVSDDVGNLFDDLIEEAESVRERVRDQASSTRPRGRGRRRSGFRRRSRAPGEDDPDVEAELSRDEAAEKPAGFEKQSSGGSANDESNPAPSETQPRAADLFPEILGWQPLVLNRDSECGRCERGLRAGESAFLGLSEKGLTQTALCGRCAASR